MDFSTSAFHHNATFQVNVFWKAERALCEWGTRARPNFVSVFAVDGLFMFCSTSITEKRLH